MPIISEPSNESTIDQRQSERAMEIRSGILRSSNLGDWVFLPEFTLSNGRRPDLIGLNQAGIIRIVEIKSSVADFRADQKWHEYLDFCDEFFFASHPEVPQKIFPNQEGFLLADKYGCEIMREPVARKLSAPTRKALTLKIARTASDRLRRFSLHEV